MESLTEDIEAVFDEESEYRDNMPENLQGSEKYEKADSACDSLESAKDTFDEALESLNDVVSSLEEAAE